MAQNNEEIASGNTFKDYIDSNVITRITTKMHRIRWTIENVSKVENDTKLIGPDIFLVNSLLVSMSFKKSDNSLFVYVCNKSNTDIKIERKLIIFNCNDLKLHEEKSATIFNLEKGRDFDLVGRIPNRERFNALPNDTLIIDVSIIMLGLFTTEVCHSSVDPKTKLIEDLETMLENSVNSDVYLQIGDERIPAHWSMLCSRSPYFKKMFDSGMMERAQNSITITDLSLLNLKKIVKFLYTANLVVDDNDDLEELFNLYYAADKYEVVDLQMLCSCKIMSKATVDNAIHIFQLAYRHSDKRLKMKILLFIECHSDAVFQTDGWMKFEANEPLAAEMFSFCLKKNKLA